MASDEAGNAEKSRRDAGFAAAEQATREAGWALSPAERLEWLERAIAFAWSAGVVRRREPPAGWDPPPAPGTNR